MSCCDSFMKYLLFIFNLVFALSGLAVLVIGAVLLANGSDFDTILSDVSSGIKAPQITLIVVGVIVFVIAFLGCCGAIRENRCMLITFAVFLLTIFIIELAIGIYAVVNFSDLKDDITKALGKHFDEINTNSDSKEAFEAIEKALECCGVSSYQDYGNYKWPVPDSCCTEYVTGCASSNDPKLLWPEGCLEKLTDFTTDAGKILGGVAIALSFIEVVGAIIALRLANEFKYH